MNKLYAPCYAALAGRSPELAWWGKFDKKRALRPELATQLRALNEEKKGLLQRLIGPLTLGPEAASQLDRLGVLPRLVVQDNGKRKNYTLTPGGFSQ